MYCIFGGDDAGAIYYTAPGSTDRVLLFTADVPGIREFDCPAVVAPAGQGYSDNLKFSGIRRLRVRVPLVDGRNVDEDSIDINHCEDLEIIVGEMYPGKTYCTTQKGASKRVRLQVGIQHGHGRETDHDYGNYVDQNISQDRTVDCALSVVTEDHSACRVRILHAHKPTLENETIQKYEVSDCAAGWFGSVYPFLKTIAGIFGIKI